MEVSGGRVRLKKWSFDIKSQIFIDYGKQKNRWKEVKHKMKKIVTVMIFVAAIGAMAFSGAVMACAPGDHVTFKTKTMGHIHFSGMDHFNAGVRCGDCHPGIFPMKKPGTPGAAKFTMDDIFAGKYCGVCHNGKRAFSPFPNNCSRCHHGMKKKSSDDNDD